MPVLMKLLGSIKIKVTKDGNGENLPYLEITEIVLAHCNIGNNNYQSCISIIMSLAYICS